MASWLQACGLFIGDKLAGATASNVLGHFEDIDFLEFHEDLLKANDTNMYMHTERELNVPAAFNERASQLIEDRNNRFVEWGWKQPRATLFLDLWHAALSKPHYLIPLRSPAAVINSLLRRESNKLLERSNAHGDLKEYDAYMANLDNHARQYERMYILHLNRILKFINTSRPAIFILHMDEMNTSHMALESKLHAWQFAIELKGIENIYNRNMLIDPDNYFVSQEDISNQAIELYNNLVAIED